MAAAFLLEAARDRGVPEDGHGGRPQGLAAAALAEACRALTASLHA